MKKLLTVTIPSYNAEKTLAYCLDSLTADAGCLKALDILVINDGSKDGTEKIAGSYAARFPDSVRLINKENGGHGSGINTGIKEAQGEYFRVLDADDWFAEGGLKELLSYLASVLQPEGSGAPRKQTVSPDLIASQFLWAFEKGSADPASFPTKAQFEEPFPGVEYGKIYPLEEIADKLYVKFHHLTVRTELLRENSIVLDEHCYYEDAEYALYPFAYAETIVFLREPLYLYRIGIRGQSMSREKLLKNVKNYDLVEASLLSFAAARPLSPRMTAYFNNFIARFHAGRIKIELNMPVSRESLDRLKKLEQDLKEHHPEIYQANKNTAVKLLRRSRYLLYVPAALAVRLRGTV